MGYTHYYTHKRRLTNSDWLDVKTDLATIISQAEIEGVQIGDGMGDACATVPDVYKIEGTEAIAFNGRGDDSHETFVIYQNRPPLQSWQEPKNRGWAFCKTARKPYDVAVTACLIYLESRFPDHFSVSSDGESKDWQAGLDLARRALPRLGNVLRIPQEIVFDSCFSRVHMRGGKYGIATTKNNILCLTDESRLTIVGLFTTSEAKEWVTEWMRRVQNERQRKLPCRCDVLGRWEACKLRSFREAAESLGYLTPAPVDA